MTTILFLTLFLPVADVSALSCAMPQDTIRASRIVTDAPAERNVGTRIVPLADLRNIVSGTGSPDPVKFLQMLPGVSTGAEGSSAMYVRGGNLGSNLVTLDGVPLYGGSHLLGLSSVYPEDIISSAVFRLGGFQGSESNLTASHIDLSTADGDFSHPQYAVSASNFLVGGKVSVPIVENKISFIGSLRVSPLGPQYNLARSIAGGVLDSLKNVGALVYDAFAKVKYLVNPSNELSLSVFNSMDGYRYRYCGYSDESMSWNNLILNLLHAASMGNDWTVKNRIAYNDFVSRQGIVRDMSGTENNLAILSSLKELSASSTFNKTISGKTSVRTGFNSKMAWFNPGTSSTFSGNTLWTKPNSPMTDNTSRTISGNAHFQLDITDKIYDFMFSGKANINAWDSDISGKWKFRFDPEASFLLRLKIAKWLSVEGTADWTVQYYHTLEGLPLGWSMDMIVPTDGNRPPEKAEQYYAGIYSAFGKFRFTVGAYTKKMYNLVYFLDAGNLFSPSLAGWENNIKNGNGTSKGIELLFEKEGERLQWLLSYTLSKTDRTFPEVNKGLTFPSEFDRRHIFNARMSLVLKKDDRKEIGLSSFFTYQSGHWTTVAAGEYEAMTIWGTADWKLGYFSSVNNYSMPPYIRLDLGCFINFFGKHPQSLNLGIYNALNRHNPFSVTYDDRTREWKKISLLPIMPSIGYKIEF